MAPVEALQLAVIWVSLAPVPPIAMGAAGGIESTINFLMPE